jgi:hypothetical protein
MKLHPEEQKLGEFGSLTLTSHRIRKAGGYDWKRRRTREMASIRLEHITHCQITSTDQPLLIVMGILLILAGAIGARVNPAFFVFGLVLGVMSIIGYITSRHSEIEISSPTLPLREIMLRARLEEAKDFVHMIEWAAI